MCGGFAIGKVGHWHFLGLGVDGAGGDADHGADGVKVRTPEIVPLYELTVSTS